MNAASNQNLETKEIFKRHENEKKRSYLRRVLEIEHGSFTPLVMGTNGGMGSECERFVKCLAAKLAEKQNDNYNSVMTWLQTKLPFAS